MSVSGLDVICPTFFDLADEDGNVEVSGEEITWLEGVGSPEGFLISYLPCGWAGGGTYQLLCAYKGDELKYTGPLYEEYGCEYNAGPFNEKLLGTWRVVGGNEIISISDSIIVFIGLTQKYTASATQLTVERLWIPEEESYRWANCNYTLSNDTLWIDNFMPLLVATYPPTFGPITLVKVKNEDLFPTLWGLQRTSCTKTIGEDEYGTVWGSRSYLMQEIETATIDGKQYLLFGTNNIYDEYCSLWLREENNKILVYSTAQKKDLVLYDFTLNVGDSLSRLYVDYDLSSVVDYDNDEWGLSPLVVTEVSTITLLDGKEYKKWTFDNGMQYVEGIGSFGTCYAHNDFYQLIANAPLSSDVYSQHLVCTSRNGQLLYQMDASEMEQLETECLCEAENPEDLFPTLWGLQRTVCNEYCGETEDDNFDNITYQQTFTSISFENNKPYILCRGYLLREESNKILLYSESLNKEIVLYDFTLEVGDSLPAYIKDFDGTMYSDDTLVVTDISSVTLLDGKEYKKWTFDNGMEYVEGIGMYGGHRNGNFFGLIQEIVVPCNPGTHLVCVSKNGKLLYQMDDAEMERLGAECLCDVETSYKSQWCNTWNVFMHSGGARLDSEETWQYKLDRDTIINGKLYSTVIYYLTSDPSREYYMGAVRFGDDRKVYRAIGNSESVVYDFTAQVGDTLGPGVVYDVEVDSLTNLKTIYFHPYDRYEDEYIEYATVKWIEGVGSTDGFLLAKDYGTVGGAIFYLLCAYRDDELKYAANKNLGCRYNAGEVTHEHFPTLAGLSRTIYEERNTNDTTRRDDFTKVVLDLSFPTLYHSQMYLRERDNKIFVVSRTYKNLTELYEYVLYDFTLEVGDSLPMLYIDYSSRGNWGPTYPLSILNVVNYRKEADGTIYPGDTLIVTEVSTITLLDGKEYKKWTFNNGMEYAEGIGSLSGDFYELIANKRTTEDLTASQLVCASQNGQLLYKMDEEEMERLGAECLCEAENPEDLFPTLWGLQRTSCSEYVDCQENETYLMQADEIKEINGKQYLKYGGVFLREEDSKVLIYSFPYEKDFVLYDWTLEIGDTLQILGIDPFSFPELEYTAVVDYVAFEEYDANGNRTIVKKPLGNKRVKDISTMRLLDGNEYKAWLFGYDWERGNYYVEGIGNASKYGGDYVDLVCPFEVPSCYYGERLVCVSRDGVLLYQIDDEEMERLGAECLCDYDRGPRKDNAKDGQIGGRPTPTQWNQLELDLREMENGTTILRAETFSYTLEDISQQVNNKTYFQLARQSTKDTATTKSVVGALHFGKDEDNRVYFLRDGVEYVLYDFTAEIGDTVEIFAGINNYPQETTYTHVVVDKDTTEDGACRMFLEVVFPEDTTTATNAEKVWLAGLGSVDGIVHNAAKRTSNAHAAPSRTAHSSDTQTSVMLCAWREDSCLYTTDHPDYNDIGCIYNQDPTAIEDTHSSSPMTDYQKLLRNGQLLIIHKGKTYNVLGVAVE